MIKALASVFLLFASVPGCSGWPGGAFSYTFPFTVTVTIPSVPGPVPVVSSSEYTRPTMEVPFNVAAVSPKITTVEATAMSPKMTVRVIGANVNKPRLVVPKYAPHAL